MWEMLWMIYNIKSYWDQYLCYQGSIQEEPEDSLVAEVDELDDEDGQESNFWTNHNENGLLFVMVVLVWKPQKSAQELTLLINYLLIRRSLKEKKVETSQQGQQWQQLHKSGYTIFDLYILSFHSTKQVELEKFNASVET